MIHVWRRSSWPLHITYNPGVTAGHVKKNLLPQWHEFLRVLRRNRIHIILLMVVTWYISWMDRWNLICTVFPWRCITRHLKKGDTKRFFVTHVQGLMIQVRFFLSKRRSSLTVLYNWWCVENWRQVCVSRPYLLAAKYGSRPILNYGGKYLLICEIYK